MFRPPPCTWTSYKPSPTLKEFALPWPRFLYRLGRWSFVRRRLVALLGVAVLAALGLLAAKAPAAPEDGFALPGTEAQNAFDLIDERFPGASSDGASARLVFVAPSGQKITAQANRQAVAAVLVTGAAVIDEPTASLDVKIGMIAWILLPGSIGDSEQAGLPVHVTVEGEPRPLSPGVDLTAYRILQEALTNAAKHAPGSTTAVTVKYTGIRIRLTVANDQPAATASALEPEPGPAASGSSACTSAPRPSAEDSPPAAGRRPDGGFLVTADLPLRTATARQDKDSA